MFYTRSSRWLISFTVFFICCFSNVISAATVSVFFAGGQSNATPRWASAIEQTLADSGSYENVLVVHAYHPGNWMYEWFNESPQGNYFHDFFNASGTGVLESALNEIAVAGNTYVFSGLFWFQGEGDTGSYQHMDIYQQRFLGMLDRLQLDIYGQVEGELPFMMTLIDGNPDYEMPAGRTWEQIEYMRQLQMTIASNASYGSFVDSRGYERRDDWHLTGSEAERLGGATANQFLSQQTISPVPVPPSFYLFVLALTSMLGLVRGRALKNNTMYDCEK